MSDYSWQVQVGLPFTATLTPPAGITHPIGARIEIPITRGIASAYVLATLNATTGLYELVIDAPLFPGPYELVWRTNEGEPPQFETFEPLIATTTLLPGVVPTVDYPDIDLEEVRPAVEDVAKLERTRTIEAGGQEMGTFTDNTRPTKDEVEDLIDQAVDDVLPQVRPQISITHYRQLRRIVTLRAALLLETSFYREQAGDSAVSRMENDYSQTLAGLQQRIADDLEQQNLIGGMEPRQFYGNVLV